MSDSARLYTATGTCTTYEYFTGTPLKRVPKQIRWAERDKVIVVGSDRGVVYVFDVETKDKVEVIHHCNEAFVQAIAVRFEISSQLLISPDLTFLPDLRDHRREYDCLWIV